MPNFNERTLLLVFNDAVEHAYYRAFAEIIFTIDSFRGKKRRKRVMSRILNVSK